MQKLKPIGSVVVARKQVRDYLDRQCIKDMIGSDGRCLLWRDIFGNFIHKICDDNGFSSDNQDDMFILLSEEAQEHLDFLVEEYMGKCNQLH